jgi:hypothetical protein
MKKIKLYQVISLQHGGSLPEDGRGIAGVKWGRKEEAPGVYHVKNWGWKGAEVS